MECGPSRKRGSPPGSSGTSPSLQLPLLSNSVQSATSVHFWFLQVHYPSSTALTIILLLPSCLTAFLDIRINVVHRSLPHLSTRDCTFQSCGTTMASSDLDQLIEMGFDQERAQLAVSKGGGSMSSP